MGEQSEVGRGKPGHINSKFGLAWIFFSRFPRRGLRRPAAPQSRAQSHRDEVLTTPRRRLVQLRRVQARELFRQSVLPSGTHVARRPREGGGEAACCVLIWAEGFLNIPPLAGKVGSLSDPGGALSRGLRWRLAPTPTSPPQAVEGGTVRAAPFSAYISATLSPRDRRLS